MSGTASTSGKVLRDFENYKNQEWLRRRKLRLEQVRKQSHDIAKALRQKVVDEEKLKYEIYQKVREVEFRDWKAEKLAHLEGKLRCALENFGEGYKLAESEPDPNIIIQERNKVNDSIAQKRGEIAYQEELRMKKLEEEKKMFPIQRRIMTRKMENLRSALVRSVPVQKCLSDKWNVPARECQVIKEKALSSSKTYKSSTDQTVFIPFQKVAGSKPKKKKPSKNNGNVGKTCACKNRTVASQNDPGRDAKTIWVNLNDIQNSSTNTSVTQSKSIKSERSMRTKTSEGVVEFYDFPSRYFCRSYKEFPHLVERIEPSEEPDAVELAKLDEEREQQEVKRRQDIEALTQERGFEALRKEKINREYQNMISKLDELSKKEKVLKSQQRSLPCVVHMTDERLSERARTRQRLMDSKFESIYYSAVAEIPPVQPKFDRITPGSGDYVDFDEKTGTGLSFSASNLKQNSPISTQSEELGSPIQMQKKQLLENIEKALREGRELRRTISRNWESRSESDETLKADRSVQSSPLEGTKCQEAQTDYVKPETITDDSLPVSTSTSYKSPPSEIKSAGLLQIIEYLGLSDDEQNDPNFRQKVKELFSNCQENSKSENGPTLQYYIKKLLNMSRECIANLSVSSENISTPNLTDLDVRNDEMDQEKTNSKGEEIVEKSGMERANRLDEVIKNWKNILEKNIRSETSEPEDEPADEASVTEEPHEECVHHQRPSDDEEPLPPYPPNVQHRYDQITKKCSERISELSNMLEQVRKDKEKLLTSTSGKSSDLENDTSSRFGTGGADESTRAVADSYSYPDESLESWPDVMNELLRKEILTSPFKWSDGELYPTNSENPTIETVIGNFRKEMNKIKTISFVSLDSFATSQSENRAREEEGSEGGRESSVESINRALTSLGLNWAKSFLRKNEESRAMSSSSDGKSEEEEEN